MGAEARAALPAVLTALKDEGVPVRVSAAEALGNLSPEAKQVLPALIEALKDSDLMVLASVVQTLAKMGAPAQPAVPGLLAILKDNEKKATYESVLDALITIGTPGDAQMAVPVLIELLGHSQAGVRGHAADTLGWMRSDARAAVPALIRTLNQKEEFSVRTIVRDALVKIGPPDKEAVPALLEAAKDNYWRVSEAAVDALGGMGADAKGAVPGLIELLQHRLYSTREKAAKALGRVGPEAKEALPVLKTAATTDKDPDVRTKAQEAIRKITGGSD
jgi:HEAT repeat protein